jgi:hypothetical protein
LNLEGEHLKPSESRIEREDRYIPERFGLRFSGSLLREAYIMQKDLTALVGWETGRSSEPAFMDMNLQAVCNARTDPEVVLVQHDEGDSMNPHGLLIAYAEATVKPVVSDFDAFTIASRGMEYEELSSEQAELMNWTLCRVKDVLDTPNEYSWTSRWLEVLKREAEQGFHPNTPKYGYGDPTSYRLIADVISQTERSGAVRHGAECFNYYFPQELDDDYLVVWEGFPDKPWDYKSEPELRSFLIDRAKEGFSFPLNPVWPVRDPGWYEVWQALQSSSPKTLDSWYPPESGIAGTINTLHEQFPGGFIRLEGEGISSQASSREGSGFLPKRSTSREEKVGKAMAFLQRQTSRTWAPARASTRSMRRSQLGRSPTLGKLMVPAEAIRQRFSFLRRRASRSSHNLSSDSSASEGLTDG